MFRTWLSGFKSRNKSKIESTLKMVFIALFIILLIYVMFFNNGQVSTNEQQIQTVYKPQETIISGSNIKEEEYKEDTNIVDVFVGYCNSGKVNEAYQLLTDECKQNLYPTVQDFKQKYCDRYFSEKKDYNLQSWVNKENRTTYQMRITQDILSSGEYQASGIYQDYITIVENGENKQININGYIQRKEINKVTNYEGIEIKVNKVDVYMDYEEYSLDITNHTKEVIMLDSMQQPKYTLRVITGDGNTHSVIPNSIRYIKLIANPGENRQIKIQFSKKYTSSSDSKYIEFSKIVKNYNEFIKNQTEYNNFTSMKVEL